MVVIINVFDIRQKNNIHPEVNYTSLSDLKNHLS